MEATAPPRALWHVYCELSDRFVGRDAILDSLEAKLVTSGRHSRAALFGLGSIGMTQLALALVHRTRQRRPERSVFWVHALNAATVGRDYRAIATLLQLPQLDGTIAADILPRVQQRLGADAATAPWLLILDGADDFGALFTPLNDGASSNDDYDSNAARLIDYLPRSAHSAILVTTRNKTAAVQLEGGHGGHVVPVGELDAPAAMQLLRASLAPLLPADFVAAAPPLLEHLTHLPLAIVQAAAYISCAGGAVTLGDYLALLQGQRDDAIALLNEDFEDLGRYPRAPGAAAAGSAVIAKTWLVSFQQIRRQSALAADCLAVMACVAPRQIPSPLLLLPAAASRKTLLDAVGVLAAYSFVALRAATAAGAACYDVHRLVHLAMRNWLKVNGGLAAWDERAAARLRQVFPGNDYAHRGLWAVYLPHAKCILASPDVAEDGPADLSKLLADVARLQQNAGQHADAAESVSELMAMSTPLLRREHPQTLNCMSWLGSIYNQLGRKDSWTKAEELTQRALAIQQRVLVAENPDTLQSMSYLAAIYWCSGQLEKSEAQLKPVVELSKRIFGPEHRQTLTNIGNLATLYRYHGRWSEAEVLERVVAALSEKVLGWDHALTLANQSNLASMLSHPRQWKEGAQRHQEVLEKRKRVLGDEHPSTLISTAQLASALKVQGQPYDEEALQRQCLEASIKTQGDEHSMTLASKGGLAAILAMQGRHNEVEPLQREVAAVSARVLGPEHHETLTSMGNLASTYWNQGRYAEAETLNVQVTESRKRLGRPEHLSTLTSIANLALTYLYQKRLPEAEALQMQVVKTCRRVYRPEHPETMAHRDNLVPILWAQRRFAEAEQLDREMIEIKEKVWGPEYPKRLRGMANLAWTLQLQRRIDEAAILMLRCCELREKTLGSNHPDTVKSRTAVDGWKKDMSASESIK